MPTVWKTPFYNLNAANGKKVIIDVTTSVSPGLPPSKVLTEIMVPFFLANRVRSIVDFGAGALRHTLPLLAAGFDVYAVEFELGFQRPVCAAALNEARRYANFTELIWPHDFLSSSTRFDAALLCYVLQTMPMPKERDKVLNALKRKLKAESYLLYMSRYNQGAGTISPNQRVSDGFFMWPKRDQHSFYREFATADTHEMFRKRS